MKAMIATIALCLFVTGCVDEKAPTPKPDIEAIVAKEIRETIQRREALKPMTPDQFNRAPKNGKLPAPTPTNGDK